MQRGMRAHAAVAQLPIQLHGDPFTWRGQRRALGGDMQDRRAVDVIDRVGDGDPASARENHLAAVAGLAAAPDVEQVRIEQDAPWFCRNDRGLGRTAIGVLAEQRIAQMNTLGAWPRRSIQAGTGSDFERRKSALNSFEA